MPSVLLPQWLRNREVSIHVDASIQQNRNAWNRLVRRRGRHTLPARDEEFHNPLAALDSNGWLGQDVRDKRVLCLAAGGGRQSALFAAAGAQVTVVDISPEMLAIDRQVAQQRGLELHAVEASMDNLSMFDVASFDIVAQPVSTCYVSHVRAVYREVARVIVPGGLYVSQHKQPASLQAATDPSPRGYELIEPYYRRGPLPDVENNPLREDGALEYLHSLEELVGGLCREGFVIEDLVEPAHAQQRAAAGSFKHRCLYLPPYLRIKARRIGAPTGVGGSDAGPGNRVWTPS